MSVWDFRQIIESAIPWWVPFGALALVAMVACSAVGAHLLKQIRKGRKP